MSKKPLFYNAFLNILQLPRKIFLIILSPIIFLYQKLSEETDNFGDEPIFDKVWLKKHILGENNEKMFDV